VSRRLGIPIGATRDAGYPARVVERLPRRAWIRAGLLAGVLVAAVAVFIWLLQQTATGAVDALDQAILRWAIARRTSILTEIAISITALGSGTLLGIGTAFVVAVLWTAGRRLAAVDTALASSVAALVTRMTKVLLARHRPPLGEPLVQVAGFSFPSGHTSGITALLTATALHSIEIAGSRSQRVVLGTMHVILILAVGWSRIYLGVHYPSDVAAGICVGVACALTAHGVVRTRGVVRRLRELLR
jgi:undecaprenyl-diphosphatase